MKASEQAARISQRALQAGGQPIGDLMSQALSNPGLISLAAGFVDQHSLPYSEVQQAVSALFQSEDTALAALQYGTTHGHTKLREILLAEAQESDGIKADLDQVVVTAGSNQLLHLLSECILNPGDIVICASPTYFVFLGTLNGIGARAWGVEADEHGMIPAALEEAWQQLAQDGLQHRVRAIYLVPYFDNPGGRTMTVERGERVVELAKQWTTEIGRHVYVISDEAYRGLRYEGDDTRSLLAFDEESDTVISAGTFSKTFAPGIRVGWGILPKHLINPVCEMKGNIDFGSPNFSQHIIAHAHDLGLLDEHLTTLRRVYREKLNAMLEAAQQHLSPIEGAHWDRPTGGLYVWLRLPEQIDTGPAGQLLNRAAETGVLYVPGQYCFAQNGSPVQKNTMRLSFGVQSCENIGKGIELLATAIRLCLR